jgi:hypothetical protein
MWAKLCWVMPLPFGILSERSNWAKPAASLDFLLRSSELYRVYQEYPELKESIWRTLMLDSVSEQISDDGSRPDVCGMGRNHRYVD